MGFAQESGYTPASFETIMSALRSGINDQFGTTYTAESFLGSNFYKFLYPLAQRVQENEVKTSEIFTALQQYFDEINARIQRPVATAPGVLEALENADYIASIKAPADADAGKLYVCVNADDGDHATGTITITSYANLVSGTDDSVTVGATTFTAQTGSVTPGATTFQAATSNAATATSLAAQINAHATAGALVYARAYGAVVKLRAINGGTAGNSIALGYTDNDTNVGATKSGTALSGGTDSDTYADDKLEINTLIKNSVAGGIVTQGSESSSITLTNGQSFDFKFGLPLVIEPLLKLTVTLSENNQVVIESPEEQKAALLANIASRYRLGKHFEPQRYFSLVDAPWAAAVKLEYSLDGGSTWTTDIFEAEFNELFDCKLTNVTLVEN